MEFVVNPAGASGKSLQRWNEVEKILKEKGAEYSVHFSTHEHRITDICKELTSTGKEVTLVMVGGDGSMNEAVNGIHDFSKTKFGMIPCGSGNDLALGLKVEKNVTKLVEQILENKIVRTMDVGKLTYHHQCDFLDTHTGTIDPRESFETVERKFNISAGLGFDAEICEAVSISKAKRVLNKIKLGSLVYLVEAVRLIFGNKHVPVKYITEDNQEKEYKECTFVVGMNTKYEGGGFQFCPHAEYNDGNLHFLTVDGLSRTKFFLAFPSAYTGGHLAFHGIYEDCQKHVHLQAKEPMWVHTDGEVVCRSKDIEISLCEEKLNLIV